MEHEVSKDIERLFEPGSESALQSYISLLHPADVAELFTAAGAAGAAVYHMGQG